MRAGEEALDKAQACSWDCDGLFTYKKKRNDHELLAIFKQISTNSRIHMKWFYNILHLPLYYEAQVDALFMIA
jgi:hypothetical protein